MKRRAAGHARLAPYAGDFMPTHCAGETCFHAHPGEQPWGTLPGLDAAAAPTCCDRKSAHGAHDFTGGRCPGVAGHALPAPVVAQRAARVRTAIAGGAQ